VRENTFGLLGDARMGWIWGGLDGCDGICIFFGSGEEDTMKDSPDKVS